MGITHTYTDPDELHVVDGVLDTTNTYIFASVITAKLDLPGWWPARVVACVEQKPFDYGHLCKGEYGYLASAEAFAERRSQLVN